MGSFYDSFYGEMMNIMQAYIVAMVVVYFILGCIFAFACRTIVKNKGYSDDSCFRNAIGGFFLGMIWVIVCACKPACNNGGYPQSRESSTEFFTAHPSDRAFWVIFSTGLMLVVIGSGVAIVASAWWLIMAAVGIVIWVMQYATAGKSKQ